MMHSTRRLPLRSAVFPLVFGRFVSASRIADGSSKASSVFTTTHYFSSSESWSEIEDWDKHVATSQINRTQVLRAYLRHRHSCCLSKVREQGLVPAVLVDGDKDRRPQDGSADVFILLDAKPLLALVKLIGKRDFVSRVFKMDIYRSPCSSELQESLQVLPRNLNYGPGETSVLNVQFIRAPAGEDLKLGVPLEFLGTHLCPGLKKGGTLKMHAKYVVYKCKATEVPAKIAVDMSDLEIGDQVRLQDLEADFDYLVSDRTMIICEVLKDVRTCKARAGRLKSKLLYKKRAFAKKESSSHARSLSEDEIDVSDDGEDEVIPYRYQKRRALACKGFSPKMATAKDVFGDSDDDSFRLSRARWDSATEKTRRFVESGKNLSPSKRRLTGASSISSSVKVADKAMESNACHNIKKKKKAFKIVESDDDVT